MASTAALHAAGLNMCELRQIITLNREATNELQCRVDKLVKNSRIGERLPEETFQMMENLNNQMTKEIIQRIEDLEAQAVLTTTDREFLQTLGAQISVCDRLKLQIAELRDMDAESSQSRRRDSGFPAPYLQRSNSGKSNRAYNMENPQERPHSTPTNPNTGTIPPQYSHSPKRKSRSSSPVRTPPSLRSPPSSNPSLERIDIQPRRRRSAERSRYSAYVPPPAHAALYFPPPTSPIIPNDSDTTFTSRRAQHSPNCSRNSPMSPTSPYSTPRRNCNLAGPVTGAGEYQFYSYADYEDSEEEEDHREQNKTSWPLLYIAY